jgi:protein tyrosine phosphatase
MPGGSGLNCSAGGGRTGEEIRQDFFSFFDSDTFVFMSGSNPDLIDSSNL